MDITTLVFYGVVCGVLSGLSPKIGEAPVRVAVGIAVGIAAAGLLPQLRAILGVG